MPSPLPIAALILAAALPFFLTWLVALVPRRVKEVSDVIIGNAILEAPLPVEQVVTLKPLLHLSRALTGNDIRGFIVGARHLPVEHTAPIMSRYIRGSDPALQLYAQSVLQSGLGQLQHWQQQLEKAPEQDERATAWLIEVGLALAHHNLCSAADRATLLRQLTQRVARTFLLIRSPGPHLLAAAAELALESGNLLSAQQFLDRLPEDSTLRLQHQPAVTHAHRRASSIHGA
jgi:hypothetical protein